MSLADLHIARVSASHNRVHADTWHILSGLLAGRTFTGELQSEPVMSLDTELGSDAREKSLLFLDNAEWLRLKALIPQPTILPLDRNFQISGKGATWEIIGDIDDNPANDRVKFELKKKSAKDS